MLIAEADRALQQMLRWDFEEMGHQVITAATCFVAKPVAAATLHRMFRSLLT